MYMQDYDDFVKNAPDSPWKRCVIRVLSTPKPDFTELDKEVEAFEKQLAEEYLESQRKKRAAREASNASSL